MSDSAEVDIIIIGSGFGGSVSALRMAEKGYRVLVIEKGRRYRQSDFPKSNWNLRKYLWLPSFFLYGIQKLTLLKDVLVLHGIGVGGGSLVYANTHLEPPATVFDDPRWTDNGWQNRLKPFYRLARKMLGTTSVKTTGESDHFLELIDRELNACQTFYKVDVGVWFGEPELTVRDPYFNGDGPDRTGCTYCGACMTGCPVGAKNTLDQNYLYLAEKLDVRILAEHEVTGIVPTSTGYHVTAQKSTGIFHPKQSFEVKRVILSAGVLGSVNLLQKCRQMGWLPDISTRLGEFVRTNSEAILGVRLPKDHPRDLNHGIAISAGFYPEPMTHIETVRFGKGHDVLSLLTTPMVPHGGRIPSMMRWLVNLIRHPVRMIRSMNPLGWAASTVILLVMQPLSNHLNLQFKKRWWRMGGRSLNSSRESGGKIPAYIPAGDRVTEKIAQLTGGTPITSLSDVFLNVPTTAHILGGCIMASGPYKGVVDDCGQVFNYPGLYVIDGSIIPANLGVNPSLTITAIAEYVMSRIEKSGENDELRVLG